MGRIDDKDESEPSHHQWSREREPSSKGGGDPACFFFFFFFFLICFVAAPFSFFGAIIGYLFFRFGLGG